MYEWSERNNTGVNIGDYFISHNSSTGDTEFFKLKTTNPGSFPTDKSDDDYWKYVGRYPKKGEALAPSLPVYQWDESTRTGEKGWLYYDPSLKAYFILKADGKYFNFPTSAQDNQSWQFEGYHP